MKVEVDFNLDIGVTDEMRKAILIALYKSGAFVKGVIADTAPIDNGDLRSRWDVDVDNNLYEASVYTNLIYAAYIEYGDLKGLQVRRNGKIPYLRPALYGNTGEIIEIFADELLKVLK